MALHSKSHKIILCVFLLAAFLGLSIGQSAQAFQPLARTWSDLAHESQIVGVVRVEGVQPGDGVRPPLLLVKFIEVFKNKSSAPTSNLISFLLDFTGKTNPMMALDPEGKQLEAYLGTKKIGDLYLVYLSPSTSEKFRNWQVKTLSYWEGFTFVEIPSNVLGFEQTHKTAYWSSPTYDFFKKLDRFCEIDALEGEDRRLAMQVLEKQAQKPDNYALQEVFQALTAIDKKPQTRR